MECIFVTNIKNLDFNSKIVFYACPNEFSYEKEISGDKSFGSQLCKISRDTNSILFVRVSTDLFGLKSTSLMVYDKGVLMGIFDEINCFNSREISVLDTSVGRFVILIEADILIDGVRNIVKAFDPDYVVVSVKDYLVDNVRAVDFGVTTYGITDLFLF